MHGYYPRRRVRYRDGFVDIAKTGLRIITAPLRLLGRAGIRVLRFCVSAVEFLTYLNTTHETINWINARQRLKEQYAHLNWSEDMVKGALSSALHDRNVEFGIKLIKRALIVAATMVSRKILTIASNALS